MSKSDTAYGYGGTPSARLRRSRRRDTSGLEQGGIFVVPTFAVAASSARNGHRAGFLTKKQNVFDDFAAAARYLIDQKYTSPASLAIIGAATAVC